MKAYYPVVAVLVFSLAACAENTGDYSDADDLISFDVAEGWQLNSKSSGMRFVRAGGAERSTLVVKPDPRDADEDVDSRRRLGLSQIASQGATLATDETYSLNGFSVWEAEYQLRNISVSSWYLFADDVQVEVKLIAEADRHGAYLADAKNVVDSIRAR